MNIWKPISAVAILAAAVCGIFLLTGNPEPANTSLLQNNTEIAALQDSISVLKTQLQEKVVETPPTGVFSYVVRRGDSYWSISKKLYGTGTKAEDIARNNSRTLDTALNIGDTLKIY